MADGDDFKCPQSINTEESADMAEITITFGIPNMAVEKKLFCAAKPKSGEAEVDVKFEDTSLELNVCITKKGKTTKYRHKVNKLPGEIVPGDCKVEYKKEQVILKVKKKDTSTWVVMLGNNGLEQAPSE